MPKQNTDKTLAPPASLANFQKNYARFLRSPNQAKRPSGVPARPSQIYTDLFFNNICGFIDKCFPVAKSLTNPARWQTLCRRFFRDHQAHSPYFNQVPFEFVTFVQRASGDNEKSWTFPRWFPYLIHYEWVELQVDTAPAKVFKNRGHLDSHSLIKLNPTAANLHYPWPVHQISANFKPRKPVDTFMVVYRDAKNVTNFVLTNQITYMMLTLLEQHPDTTVEQLLLSLCELVGHPNPEQFIGFGKQMVHQFVEQQIITFKEC